jgi:hypothetical protein
VRRSSLHQATISGQGLYNAIVSGQSMHQAAVSGQVPHQVVTFGHGVHWAVALGHWLPCTAAPCQSLHCAHCHRNKHNTITTFSMQALHKFLKAFQ